MHQHTPTVVRLQLHLPDQQMVLFDPDQVDHEHVLHKPNIHKTTLTQFFVACQKYEMARMLTYPKMPYKFVWNTHNKEWKPRQRGNAIGRVYFAGPAAGERYYLRMLLYIVTGPTSWDDLKTVNRIVHNSFKAACAARGLLKTDEEFDHCLKEAAIMQTARLLRILFAIILLENGPANPLLLWSTHADKLSDDCKWRLQQRGVDNPTDEQAFSLALHDLNKILLQSGKTLQDFGLPLPTHIFGDFDGTIPHVIAEQISFNRQHLDDMWHRCLLSSNKDQRAAFEAVNNAYESNQPGIFFIDGPGGTGKTFVENMILARVRSNGDIAIAVASSGVAALLLDGGRTAHSRFKIPINTHSDSLCSIKAQSDLAKLIQQAKVIIWDEAPMQHKHLAEAVNRTLQDIRKCDTSPFGGVIMIFGGDFRQCAPVVPQGTRTQIVDASIKNASFWNQVVMLPLTINMRLLRDVTIMTPHERDEAEHFANWLLQVGEGLTDGDEPGLVRLPEQCCIHPTSENSLNQLIDAIYPGINELDSNEDVRCTYFRERAILAAHNACIDELNEEVLSRLPGEEKVYLSADNALNDNGNNIDDLPVEYVNRITLANFPLHRLVLKVGSPVIVLRNLHPGSGLCNGTRLLITRLGDRVIEGKILTGNHAGDTVLIPRIALTSQSTNGLPFTLRRIQFPLRLAFGMTINKSQGQSLTYLGLDLTTPVFAHGQLYVSLSRATKPKHLQILLDNTPAGQANQTPNVVYDELLRHNDRDIKNNDMDVT
jgi:hypothetical protein